MKINGAEVSEDQIDEWVTEAEAGYNSVVPVRLDPTLLARLDGRAEHDHQSRSEIIRAAIRAYVA